MKKQLINGSNTNYQNQKEQKLFHKRFYLKFSIIKILFLSDNFVPEVNAPATRTFEHCREWVKNGAEVTVVTCFPNFPNGKIYDGYKNRLYEREIIEGIEVIRVWSFIAANQGFIKRTLDYFSFALMSLLLSVRIKCDIIIATSPQFFTALSGMILSKIKRKPWIMEVRDLWPDSILAVEAIKNKKIISLLKKLERKCYKESNRIITVTDSFKRIIVSDGIHKEKISVVKNGVNLDLFSPRGKNNNLLSKHKLENKFLVGYIGTLGMAHGMDFIVNVAKGINDNNIHFILIGNGANKQSLEKSITKNKLANISIIDAVSKRLIVDYIASIDIALINLKKLPLFKTVIPSKIFENAAMEKPILLGVDGESRQIIEEYSAGVYFEPESKSDFINKLNLLKNDRDLYKLCQRGCKKLAYDFDRKSLANRMFKDIQSLIKEI